jgi:spore coat protein U-like protein
MVIRKSVTILFRMIYTLYTRSSRNNCWSLQANDKTMRSSGNSRAMMMNDTEGSTVTMSSSAREEQ